MDVITAGRARADGGLDSLDRIDVDDWLLSALADSLHGGRPWRKVPGPVMCTPPRLAGLGDGEARLELTSP